MMNNDLEFKQVYTAFEPKIRHYLARLINAKEAEDLTQEVFLKVARTLKTFRKESELLTWIYRIATNTAIDRMRSPSFKQELAEEHSKCSLLAKTFSIEEQIIHKETNECIRGVIENLPENYRMIVILSELEGLQNKEIARILGLSPNVVKIRLHRGKIRLKKQLLNYCNIYWDEHNELTCEPKIFHKK